MVPFKNYGPMDRSERKALWLAIAAGSLFIVTLAVAHPPAPRKHRLEATTAKPSTPFKYLEPESTPVEVNDRYRVVPEDFKNIDFKNHSYGVYKYPNGKEIDLTLYGGELRLPDDLGWFSLKDVYYTSVTGDERPDAIVQLSHVQCGGGSCDGGSALLAIFQMRGGKLNKIWQYETGSYAYGCGLKSLTLDTKKIVVGLFGRCPDAAKESPGRAKFMVENVTYVLFVFDGHRFIAKTEDFVTAPARDVKNYRPQIYFF